MGTTISTRISPLRVTKNAAEAVRELKNSQRRAVLYEGDCLKLLKALPDESVQLTITSPPYCMGKKYSEYDSIEQFIEAHKQIFPEIVRVTKPGGSICWQVGFHVDKGVLTPLDFLVHDLLGRMEGITLRNRIVWTFGHGLHCDNRFSGRYEVVMWYTKDGADYYFDLDTVRVPQKYPGKRASKGPNKGKLSGNPLGKNPSDIWDIPNVKANHVEKTDHPCQFPVALVTRLIRSLCPQDGLVLDPFSGVSSTGVAAVLDQRRFIGAEIESHHVATAKERLKEAFAGTVRIRPIEREIYEPKPTEKVAMKPEHFWQSPPSGTPPATEQNQTTSLMPRVTGPLPAVPT